MSKNHPLCAAGLGVLLWAVFTLGTAATSVAQTTCVGFSSFQSLTTAQLATLQMRLVPVTVNEKTPPALAFTYFSNVLTPSSFMACEAPGVSYAADGMAPLSFTAGTSELHAVITNLAAIPAVVAGGVSPTPWYSFEMYESQPNPIGFEVVLDQTASAAVFGALRSSFPTRPEALALIDQMSCGTGFQVAGTPTDVSPNVPVKLQSVRLKRDTGTFVGTLTITNNSGGPLATPLSIVFDLSGHSVALARPDGRTCVSSPVGRGYINVATPPGAGGSTSIPIEFLNPDKENISFNQTIVLAGPGAR